MSAYKALARTGKVNRAPVISEKIYYWMAAQNIPSSYEKWHLSRLLNLLEIAADESDPKRNKKMSMGEIFRENTDLNMARRKALKSRG